MTRQTLLVLAASFYQLEAITTARRLGRRVITVDNVRRRIPATASRTRAITSTLGITKRYSESRVTSGSTALSLPAPMLPCRPPRAWRGNLVFRVLLPSAPTFAPTSSDSENICGRTVSPRRSSRCARPTRSSIQTSLRSVGLSSPTSPQEAKVSSSSAAWPSSTKDCRRVWLTVQTAAPFSNGSSTDGKARARA